MFFLYLNDGILKTNGTLLIFSQINQRSLWKRNDPILETIKTLDSFLLCHLSICTFNENPVDNHILRDF